jgi:Calcineurin-like phosphoesterase
MPKCLTQRKMHVSGDQKQLFTIAELVKKVPPLVRVRVLSKVMIRFTFLIAVALATVMPVRAADTPPFVPGSWTLVVLPDTQRYTVPISDPGLKTFDTITQWIADNKDSSNIRFVLHEGDITGGNKASTWQVASDAMAILDNANIPYSLATGNHDHDCWDPSYQSSPTRDTKLNNFFPVSRSKKMPTYGGVFELGKMENHYHLFSASGKDYITVALEWGPRDEALAWADKILTQHSDRTALIVTHVYTYSDGSRYDWAKKGARQKYNPHCSSYAFSTPHDGTENVNDGQQIWDKLVSKHANVSMVFSGHVAWAGARQTAVGKHGQVVHEMLAAYHDPYEGPTTGYIRLLEFLPDGKTVQVKTYSPKLDEYMTDDTQQFTLQIKTPSH